MPEHEDAVASETVLLAENDNERIHNDQPDDAVAIDRLADADGENNAVLVVGKEEPAEREPRRLRSLKIAQTLALYLGFLTIGVLYSIVGPTLLDLEQTANGNTETIAYIFIGRSIGGLVGACIAGAVFCRFNHWVQLALSQLAIAVTSVLVPHIPRVMALSFLFSVTSMSSGFFDTAGNMCLLSVWGTENGPWMQALHTIFALGGLLSPIIAKPFLMEDRDSDSTNSTSSHDHCSGDSDNAYVLSPTNGNETALHVNVTCDRAMNASCETPEFPLEETTEIWKAYLIAACLSLLASIFLFIIFFISRNFNKKVSATEKKPDEDDKMEVDKKFKITVVVLVLLFYWFYCIIEITYGSYLFTYAVKHLCWSKSTAADLCTSFWIAFTVGRAGGILFIRFMRPAVIIPCGCLVLTICLGLLVFLADRSPLVLWFCNVILSFAMAPVFAAGITWTEQYVEVTGMVGSVFMIGGTAGDTVGPVVMGAITRKYGFEVFPYMLFPVAILTCVTFGLMLLVGKRHGERMRIIDTIAIDNE